MSVASESNPRSSSAVWNGPGRIVAVTPISLSVCASEDATPGSVYLWDAHDRMAVVRIFGATAKIRTLYYRRGARGWTR